MTSEEFKQIARAAAEAGSEWTASLREEFVKGTETDAEMRKMMAESRIDAGVFSRYLETREAFDIAQAELRFQELEMLERVAAAHEEVNAREREYRLPWGLSNARPNDTTVGQGG